MKISNENLIFLSAKKFEKAENVYYFVKVLNYNETKNDYNYYMLNDKEVYEACINKQLKAFDTFSARTTYTCNNNKFFLHIVELI